MNQTQKYTTNPWIRIYFQHLSGEDKWLICDYFTKQHYEVSLPYILITVYLCQGASEDEISAFIKSKAIQYESHISEIFLLLRKHRIILDDNQLNEKSIQEYLKAYDIWKTNGWMHAFEHHL